MLNKPKEFLKNLCQKVSDKSGCTKFQASIVAQGHNTQLRKMDSVTAIARLTLEIPQVAKIYGARYDVSENVLSESIRLVMKKFGRLGLIEIREAYRQHASGELKVPGGEMWGGEFNVAQIGKILTAYCQNRSKVLSEILKLESEIKEAEHQAKIHILKQAEFDKTFPKEVLTKRKEIENWFDVPSFWYQLILDRGWIEFYEGEAKEIFEEAKELARIELKKKESQRNQLSIQERFKMTIPTEDELAKRIARQLTIFKKVVQVKSWRPILKAS